MLIRLEKDRLSAKLEAVEATLQIYEVFPFFVRLRIHILQMLISFPFCREKPIPTRTILASQKTSTKAKAPKDKLSRSSKRPGVCFLHCLFFHSSYEFKQDSRIPVEDRVNPFADAVFEAACVERFQVHYLIYFLYI